jgi:D-alanine-D-alanine ligase
MPTVGRKIRVAVVFGGRSSEHAISAVSAGSVLGALDRDRYEVVPVGITPKGAWVLAPDDPATLRIDGRRLPYVDSGPAVVLPPDPTAGGLIVVDPAEGARALEAVDVVFPVLHGPYGEDGTIQGLLEMAGVPYVGAGVLGSAVAMDKEYAKKLLQAEGLPVGDYLVLRNGRGPTVAEMNRMGLPAFVKPARGGSSIGISRVSAPDQWDAALATAREVDPKVVVEAGIAGREIEVGVLQSTGGGPPEASLPAEIRLLGGREWYDFDAKYLDDACEFDIPARLPGDQVEELQMLARRAFIALDLEGLARVDFFVTQSGRALINEVNTMPGFTPISMFPRAWAATGLAYPDLLDRLIGTAMRSR